MAVDYYSFSPKQVLYEYPPRKFRRPIDRTQEFYNAYAVVHLVTYHDSWKEYFRRFPELFDEQMSFGHATVFARTRHTMKILRGEGSVLATANCIHVNLENAEGNVVLAYNWIDGLECEPSVELKPFTYMDGMTLISAKTHGSTNFTISYHP